MLALKSVFTPVGAATRRAPTPAPVTSFLTLFTIMSLMSSPVQYGWLLLGAYVYS